MEKERVRRMVLLLLSDRHRFKNMGSWTLVLTAFFARNGVMAGEEARLTGLEKDKEF